jgi:UDP-glucuronate 4-epimerase
MKYILVTGAAGFIGYSITKKISNEYKVIGIDNLNTYYDLKLKKDRLKNLDKLTNFKFYKFDIENSKKLENIFKKYKFHCIIHLAAQAGVRYSINHPREYLNSNIVGFYNIIELGIKYKINHFIYASSSSVYGNSKKYPTNEDAKSDAPLSFYAASKKTNELIAYSFANIYKLKCTALRFFTVYGPFGRPDMAPMIFADKVFNNKRLELFNNGNLYRDFTYIDYVVDYVFQIIEKPPKLDLPHRVLNIGNKSPVKVKSFLKEIEKYSNIKANVKNMTLPIGDVYKTYADVRKINKIVKKPPVKISYKDGIKFFLDWYIDYYKIRK